mgnify:CR=1 FL=1
MSSATARQTADERSFFLALISVLVGFGVLMVHSASITSWPTNFEQVYLTKHLIFLVISVISASIAAMMPARFWFRAAPWLFAGVMLLLVAVLIPGIGTSVKGARRWLRLGPQSLQPSELAKLVVPLLVARMMVNRRETLRGWISGTIPFALPIGLAIGLVLIEPDLGTALFVAGAGAVTLFYGGWPIRNYLLGVGAAVPAVIVAITAHSYRLRRITDYISVWTDLPNSDAWQLKQSLLTLGHGGAWGVGLGRGTQKLSFLPESNTDFVFAVVGEELGLAGTLGVAALWCGIFYVGIRLFRRFKSDSYAAIVGQTLITQIVGQALINAWVVTALVPTTGVPHPLVSYGGTSLLVSLISFGVMVSLARAEPETDAEVLE